MTPRRNAGHVYRGRVAPGDAGLTVLEYHARRYDHSSADTWARHCSEGRVRRNGVDAAADDLLRVGDELEFHRPGWDEPPAPRDFVVAHEDDDVLVVVKPAGLQVLPAGGFLENTLLHVVRDGRAERAEWSPVHRLGRGTSGLCVFGKTRAARAALSAQLRDHSLGKLYLGLVAGAVLPSTFVGTQPIGRVSHPLCAPHGVTPTGKPSRTRVRVLWRGRAAGEASLVAAWPITGRPDQIRIHLAAAGAPLVGDPLFLPGGALHEAARPGDIGYRLHATAVRFRHPCDGRIVKLRSLPDWPLAVPLTPP